MAANPHLERRGLVGELIGPAGVGKTTVLEALKRRSSRIVSELSPTRLEQLPQHVRNAGLLLPALLRRPQHARSFTWPQARAMAYLRAWQEPALRLAHDQGLTVLLDHGPVFRLARLGEFGSGIIEAPTLRTWWRRTCAQWAAILDVLIWLDAPDAILIQRVRDRDHPHRIDTQSDAEALRFLARYRRAFEQVVRLLEQSAAPLVLRYDTTCESTDDIVNHVLEVLETRASAA